MKKFLTVVLVLAICSANAQSVDYNLDDGIIAEGYDVVSYFDNLAKEGSSKYVYTYDNVKFKFSSEKNLNKFKAKPSMYVPQYGGWCAYAMGAKGKKVSIDPETFEIRDGKLYLFYNSWGNNTLETWLDSPTELRAKADKNWESLQ